MDWDDVTGAVSYELHEDDNADFTSPTVLYNGPNSQYDVHAQDIGRWYYRVRASNAGGDGPWSSTEWVDVLDRPFRMFLPLLQGPSTVALEAPTLEPIDNADAERDYLVDWSDVTGATSYELEEAEDAEFSSPTVVYSGTDSEYAVTAHEGGLWYYRVRASDDMGDGAWSNTESVGVIPEPPVLAAISNPEGDGEYLVD
ncbi:MAG: hypothetical protein GWN18_12500, partial [Thermoplasmata archaeon]|nr:hypothetical protein [Thermoplasmata archaeon]NIS12533.1 hypothetical protein [Thermoplasmata archaeon]NIS20779.1 hypothetical protein [Thermoplasmata archaeon]NIU49850.1 hypothetical protein [Thermoplasmata archaeon]NIV79541.1 hypothetical protein [Thermoplasmata archaeon]